MNTKQLLIWIQLNIKRLMHQRFFWMLIILLPFAIYFVYTISIPNTTEMTILVSGPNNGISNEIINKLIDDEDSFDFKTADADSIQSSVISGKADCGFIFCDNFNDKMQNGDLKNIIKYINASTTTKGETAKEKVYSVLFEKYSNIMLTRLIEDKAVFNSSSSKLTALVLKYNEYYLNNDTFYFTFENFNSSDSHFDINNNNEHISSVKSIIAVFIFILALLCAGELVQPEPTGIYTKLSRFIKVPFQIIEIFTPLLIFSLWSVLIILFLNGFNKILTILPAIMLFDIICTIWAYIYQFPFKNPLKYYGSIPILLLLTILLCPSFVNIESFVPVLGIIKYIFPLAYY